MFVLRAGLPLTLTSSRRGLSPWIGIHLKSCTVGTGLEPESVVFWCMLIIIIFMLNLVKPIILMMVRWVTVCGLSSAPHPAVWKGGPSCKTGSCNCISQCAGPPSDFLEWSGRGWMLLYRLVWDRPQDLQRGRRCLAVDNGFPRGVNGDPLLGLLLGIGVRDSLHTTLTTCHTWLIS